VSFLIKENNKKCIHVIAINNWQPELCAITIPNLMAYAKKIGADFNLISETRFDGFPPNYERFQIWETGRDYEWNFNIDADTILRHDCDDPTEYVPENCVASLYGIEIDHYFNTYNDPYFTRSGNKWGVADQFTLTNKLIHNDFWLPTEMSFQETSKKCFKDPRQVSEYILSRNMARFGLKHTGVLKDHNKHYSLMFTTLKMSVEEAINKLKSKLKKWNM